MAQLTHIRLLVADFPACFKFYRDVMDFEVIEGDEHGPYTEFKAGDAILALFPKEMMSEVTGTIDKPVTTEAQDSVCLCFDVDDVDSAYNRMKAAGGRVALEPEDRPPWGIRTAHFYDPDGNLIEINKGLPAEG